MAKELTVLAEGKTKRIFQNPGSRNQVIVRSKDDITAGNGMRHNVIPGKGAAANRTTCSVFRFLNGQGIRTHYRRQRNAVDFLAVKLKMLPLEVVVRNVAAGSYLKRSPHVSPGTVLNPRSVELYYKDDAAGDPLVIIDVVNLQALFFDPSTPLTSGLRSVQELDDVRGLEELEPNMLDVIAEMALDVNSMLGDTLDEMGYTLVDIKLEFGLDVKGNILLGDVVDNDSWRLRRGGPDGEELSKQRWYRDPPEITQEVLDACLRGYEEVADLTERFHTP